MGTAVARASAQADFSKRGASFNIPGAQADGMDKNLIPGCTYCHPQVASVGLTEARAKEGGREIRVGRFPFVGNGKAIALGEDQGLVKVVFDKKTGQLLGAHMIDARDARAARKCFLGDHLAKRTQRTGDDSDFTLHGRLRANENESRPQDQARL